MSQMTQIHVMIHDAHVIYILLHVKVRAMLLLRERGSAEPVTLYNCNKDPGANSSKRKLTGHMTYIN